jgi:hypothetical protein
MRFTEGMVVGIVATIGIGSAVVIIFWLGQLACEGAS